MNTEQAIAQLAAILPARVARRIVVADPTDDDSCLIWPGATDGPGYAKAGIGGRTVALHRLVAEAVYGEIPPGLQVDHLCRVRRCLRHLEVVTQAENLARGSWAHASLALHPSSGVDQREESWRRAERLARLAGVKGPL